MKQFNTTNTTFDALGACFVGIQKGSFNQNMQLEAADFSYSDINTGTKVAQIPEPKTPPDWVEAYLDANGMSKVNNVSMGRTQFRLYFNNPSTTNYVGWYSGEANISGQSTPPQLIVQYSP